MKASFISKVAHTEGAAGNFKLRSKSRALPPLRAGLRGNDRVRRRVELGLLSVNNVIIDHIWINANSLV